MRCFLFVGLVIMTTTNALASKKLDSYVLGTGEAGAKRLDFQSSLMNETSFKHVKNAGLKPGQVVYDVGCGTGSMTEHLAQIVGPNGHVYAIDRSVDQLRLAGKRIEDAKLDNVTFIQADLTAPDFPCLKQADMVYARMILSHLERPAAALELILKLAKPGGLVLLQEPVNSTNQSEGINVSEPLVEVFMANGKVRGLDYDLGLKIKQMALDQGLEVIDLFDWHVVMEPDVARDFLTVSFNEWGRAALRDGLIDQGKFDRCMDIAEHHDSRFHLATNYYLTAKKPA